MFICPPPFAPSFSVRLFLAHTQLFRERHGVIAVVPAAKREVGSSVFFFFFK